MSLIVTDNPFKNLLHGTAQFSVPLNERNENLIWNVVNQRQKTGWQKDGRRGQDPGSRIDNEFYGAIGECALAIHLNKWWDGGTEEVFTEADVSHYQVKATRIHTGRLFLHKDTHDAEVFVLATCWHYDSGWVELRGWMYGHEAKNDDLYWEEPKKGNGRWCYCITQEHLHPMNTLPGL